MSIRIQSEICTGCGRCAEACPGNLIKRDADGKAYIKRNRDCWGCTSCVKECAAGAILFYLGADAGGRGSTLSVNCRGNLKFWKIKDPYGNVKEIAVDGRESNKY